MTISKTVIATTDVRTEKSKVLRFIGTDHGPFAGFAQTANPSRTPYGKGSYFNE